jgi:hypothetical protein
MIFHVSFVAQFDVIFLPVSLPMILIACMDFISILLCVYLS